MVITLVKQGTTYSAGHLISSQAVLSYRILCAEQPVAQAVQLGDMCWVAFEKCCIYTSGAKMNLKQWCTGKREYEFKQIQYFTLWAFLLNTSECFSLRFLLTSLCSHKKQRKKEVHQSFSVIFIIFSVHNDKNKSTSFIAFYTVNSTSIFFFFVWHILYFCLKSFTCQHHL